MKKVVLAIFFVSNFVFSQETITKNLGDFDKIKTYRGLKVELIRSETPKYILEGEKSDEVIIKNVNGLLKISMKAIETFYVDEVKVSIYFKNNINLIDANEGSSVYSDETFKQEKIVLKAQEAGRIKIKTEVDQVDVKSVTGGKIELEGYATNQNVLVNTGGIYKGGDLQTESTIVKASTGGTAIVNASNLVDANANLGGTITIKGNPEEIKKEESLGGYIRD